MKLGNKVTNPGEMRTKITLKKRTITQDDAGFETEAYVTIAAVWAKWVGVHGSEAWTASTVNAQRAATVLIRYRSEVDETCVVILGSDIYEITSIDDIQKRNEYLELKVRRMVAG